MQPSKEHIHTAQKIHRHSKSKIRPSDVLLGTREKQKIQSHIFGREKHKIIKSTLTKSQRHIHCTTHRPAKACHPAFRAVVRHVSNQCRAAQTARNNSQDKRQPRKTQNGNVEQCSLKTRNIDEPPNLAAQYGSGFRQGHRTISAASLVLYYNYILCSLDKHCYYIDYPLYFGDVVFLILLPCLLQLESRVPRHARYFVSAAALLLMSLVSKRRQSQHITGYIL